LSLFDRLLDVDLIPNWRQLLRFCGRCLANDLLFLCVHFGTPVDQVVHGLVHVVGVVADILLQFVHLHALRGPTHLKIL